MVSLNAHFDGKTIVLDEPFSMPLATGTRLTIHIETLDAGTVDRTAQNRFRPLNIQIAPELSNQIALEREFNIEES
jgi:hypothetical protein